MAKIPALLLYIYATFYLDQLMHETIKYSKIYIFGGCIYFQQRGKIPCPEEIV
jgi:hypothetical protein